MSDDIVYNHKNLDQLLKALKGKMPVARVGILGKKNSRTDTMTNATVGAIHEFGSGKMPQRSFLRVPITQNLQSYLNKSGLFNQDVVNRVIKDGSIKLWVSLVGKVGVSIVQDAFASNGFGKWAKWKGSYKSKTGNILVNTTQLRDSITSEVV